MGGPFKDIEHIFRLILVAAGIVIVYFGMRYFFVPPSFGVYGHYRADSLKDFGRLPVKHAGSDACLTCHPDIVNTKTLSRHKPLSCEVCHGPLAAHIKDPMQVKPTKPNDDKRCLFCHTRLVSRPWNFPQVDPPAHAKGIACLTCHRPHHPELAANGRTP